MWQDGTHRWAITVDGEKKSLKPANLASVEGVTRKAWYRLGRSLALLRCFGAARVALQRSDAAAATELASELKHLASFAEEGYSIEHVLAKKQSALAVEYVGPVEMVLVPGKGRGLVATKALEAGKCVLACRAAVSTHGEIKSSTIVSNSSNCTYSDTSSSEARSWLVRSCAEDATLRRRLEVLSDGRTVPGLAPMRRLLQVLDLECALPLLPARAPFVVGNAALDSLWVERACELNCHGDSSNLKAEEALKLLQSDLSAAAAQDIAKCNTSLYTSVSLLNHSNNPNTFMLPLCIHDGDAVAIFTSVPVSNGEELTTCYSEDADALQRKWGIGSK